MKLLPCAVRGVLAGLMISIGGYVYLGCENRVVGAVFFTVGLITITLFGFDLYTGKIGYWLGQSRQERWQTLLSLPCNAVGCLIAGLARRPAGAVLALCEARLTKAPLILLVDGIFCGILIFICVEIYKTRGTVLGILICIPTFILCGFEHSVADIFISSMPAFSAGRRWAWCWRWRWAMPLERSSFRRPGWCTSQKRNNPIGNKTAAWSIGPRGFFYKRSHLLIDILLDAVCVRRLLPQSPRPSVLRRSSPLGSLQYSIISSQTPLLHLSGIGGWADAGGRRAHFCRPGTPARYQSN